jgi:hypothetical protein
MIRSLLLGLLILVVNVCGAWAESHADADPHASEHEEGEGTELPEPVEFEVVVEKKKEDPFVLVPGIYNIKHDLEAVGAFTAKIQLIESRTGNEKLVLVDEVGTAGGKVTLSGGGELLLSGEYQVKYQVKGDIHGLLTFTAVPRPPETMPTLGEFAGFYLGHWERGELANTATGPIPLKRSDRAMVVVSEAGGVTKIEEGGSFYGEVSKKGKVAIAERDLPADDRGCTMHETALLRKTQKSKLNFKKLQKVVCKNGTVVSQWEGDLERQ